MSTLLHVKVEQKHIDEGQPRNVTCCPIALAIQEQYPATRGEYLSVENTEVEIGDDVYDMPGEASDFVENFDNGDTVEPFEFDLVLNYSYRTLNEKEED